MVGSWFASLQYLLFVVIQRFLNGDPFWVSLLVKIELISDDRLQVKPSAKAPVHDDVIHFVSEAWRIFCKPGRGGTVSREVSNWNRVRGNHPSD